MNDQDELQKAINHYEYRVNKRKEDIDIYRNSHNQELIMAADTLERALERDTIILSALKAYQMQQVEPCSPLGQPITTVIIDGKYLCQNCGRALKDGDGK